MSQEKEINTEKAKKSPISGIITLILVIWAMMFITEDLSRFVRILAVLAGFGAVIFIHELGHFSAAKSVGIIVEAFSIGFGPVVLGFKKCKAGLQVKILPTLLPGKDGIGKLGFIIPRPSDKDGETDYRISLIPLGGYVAMLGQADMGADKEIENPRAYTNKPVWARAWAISAGVIFNMVSAAIAFIYVFSAGIDMPPAIAGHISSDTPYYQAGGRSGDIILEINGRPKKHLMYMDLMIASAFSNGEPVSLKVQRIDGTVEDIVVKPEMNEEIGAKLMGIAAPSSLRIADFADTHYLETLESMGLWPGDTITAINDEAVNYDFELVEKLEFSPGQQAADSIKLTVKRDVNGQTIEAYVFLPIKLSPYLIRDKEYQKMSQTVLGLKPRLVAKMIMPGSPAEKAGVESGDILQRIGNQLYPDFDEAISIINESAKQPLSMIVQRPKADGFEEKELIIIPEMQKVSPVKRLFGVKSVAKIGLVMASEDTQSTVVAKSEYLSIPRGAVILAVDGVEVANYGDIIRELQARMGQEVIISYKTGVQADATEVVVPEHKNWIGFVNAVDTGGINLGFEALKHKYQAENMTEALVMGRDMTGNFISQTFATIRGMINRSVSPKAASGPVGILQMSYEVVSQRSLVDYVYFMAMISVCIAVFNFLPLPILDGGLLVLLLIEKIKGSPVSAKIQEVLVWAGLLMIGSLFLYITFNDIKRVIGL